MNSTSPASRYDEQTFSESKSYSSNGRSNHHFSFDSFSKTNKVYVTDLECGVNGLPLKPLTARQKKNIGIPILKPNNIGMNIVLDLGANIECNDQNLVDFAELGSALFKSLYPNDNPKVSRCDVSSQRKRNVRDWLFPSLHDWTEFNHENPEVSEIDIEHDIQVQYSSSLLSLSHMTRSATRN